MGTLPRLRNTRIVRGKRRGMMLPMYAARLSVPTFGRLLDRLADRGRIMPNGCVEQALKG